jgi:peptide/nickel transport system ATP-binding protein
MTEPAVSIRDVSVRFTGANRQPVMAVEQVSLDVQPGDLLCLVGESGCGKTTLGKVMAGLVAPTSGDLVVGGSSLVSLSRRDRREAIRRIQYIHQDPYSSLIPGMRVAETLMAAMPRTLSREKKRAEVARLLDSVGLDATEVADRFPNELSGGQRQRVSIARALTVRPEVLVADEAVSMIDAGLRVSILDSLKRVRDERHLAVVLITHDLGVASYFADEGRIAVMYLGRVVEIGPSQEIVKTPNHPYAKALVAAAGAAASATNRYLAASIASEVPDPQDVPSGCPFHPRCADRIPSVCTAQYPQQITVGRTHVACHAVANALNQQLNETGGRT